MADPRFFTRAGPITLAQVLALSGAEAGAGVDPLRAMDDVAPLETAQAGDIAFLDNKKYVGAFEASKAGACFVHPSLAGRAPAGMALLLSTEPYRAYALTAQAFYPVPAPIAGIAHSAVVDSSAVIGEGTEIAANAVIEAGAQIGARCRIGANVVVGSGVVIGEDSTVNSNVSLSHCRLGKRVMIHAGVRIGQDGFGFAMSEKGFVKVPQLGRVLVEDDVDIGANTTIDRGAGPDTIIGAGTRIDNLVQIGHNVQIGRCCVIVAQVGISGSTRIEDFVVLAGQIGVAGHLKIGKGARIAAQSGVMRDVEPGQTVGGSPAVPVREWHRQTAALARLAKKKSE